MLSYETHIMMARARSLGLIALLVLGLGPVLTATPAEAAEKGDVTLEGIVNNTILGHAEDGYYLNFKPFANVELPRIMLVRTADGDLGVEAYGSTTSLLRNGPYGIVHDGGESERICTARCSGRRAAW